MAYQPKSYRKFLVGAVSTAVVASSFAGVAGAAANFTDVNDNYKAAVDYLVAKGIQGTSATTFGTYDNIKRVDAAVFVVKALGLDVNAAPASGFTDVPERAVKEVNALKAAGITSGKSATEFGAQDLITRGELAIWLDKAFDLKGEGDVSAFTDANGIYTDAIKALVANNITKGTSATTFGTKDPAKRGDFAVFVKKAADTIPAPVMAPAVESVSAINATTVEVKFEGALSKDLELDFSNFVIDGGLAITDAKISSDRKSATLTTSSDLTRNKEYKVSLFGVKDAEGNDVESSGTFTWEVAEGTVVALGTTSLDKGEKTGLTVKDAAGKAVKDATVEVTSMNSNLVTVTNGGPGATPSAVELTAVEAGTVDVKVVTTLPTGEKLTNTFKVTVKEEEVKATTAGFTLVEKDTDVATSIAALTNDETLANTRAFKDFASKTTEVQLAASGSQATYYLLPFDEVGGNPDTKYVDFKDATRVTISNAQVGAVELTGAGTAAAEVEFTPIAAGKTNVNVFFKDGTYKTYPVTVEAAPKITTIQVNATQIDLSDEFVGGSTTVATANTFADSQEGVDAKLVTIDALDQFKDEIDFDANAKVVIASSTEGISLFTGSAGTYTTPVTPAGLTSIAAGPIEFAVVAEKDTPIKDATVTVSYYKNATDSSPTTTKTIKVNVADIDQDAIVADIDVNTVSEIDANFAAADDDAYKGIDFTSTTAAAGVAGAEIFSLDKDGNRLEAVTTGIVANTDANNTEAAKYVSEIATDAGVQFTAVNDALTYLRAASTVDVTVSAEGVTKVLPITYKNTAVVPNKATVSTNTIAIKGKAADLAGLTLEDIIFGQLDTDQLVLDDSSATAKATITGTDVVAVKKTADNKGYKFNQSLVTITGTDGKVLPIGSAVYGTDTTSVIGAANTWNNSLIQAFESTPFVATDFEVEFALANILTTGSASVDNTNTLTDEVTVAAGESASFTLVITGIYTNGSVAAIESGASADEKAKHNLLAAPVQLNVSVSAE